MTFHNQQRQLLLAPRAEHKPLIDGRRGFHNQKLLAWVLGKIGIRDFDSSWAMMGPCLHVERRRAT